MANLPVLPYGRQTIDDDDVAAVVTALRGDWLTQGPTVARFEDELCAATGAKFAVAVANGTAALHLACLAAGVGPGDVGISPTITFVASANCVRYAGGTPHLVDVDPETALVSLDALRAKVAALVAAGTPPKVIIPVDMTGAVAPLAEVAAIAKSVGARVIEDASHSLGATYQHEGKSLLAGSCVHADMATLSFHPVKPITTGEGGAILTNDEGLARDLRDLRTHGITRDAARLTAEDGPWYYEQHVLGFNYRIADIQCALGVSQAKKLPAFVARRRAIARRYDQAFAADAALRAEVAPLVVPAGQASAYHLYAVRVVARPGDDLAVVTTRRRALFVALRERSIAPQVHYIPIHRQPDFKKHGLAGGDFPGAEAYYASCISLPMFPSLTDADVDRVVATLRDALASIALPRRRNPSATCAGDLPMSTITIGNRTIGDGAPCFIIAEMSANHDQSLERALKLVDVAADAGVDAVKVQSYKAETMTPDTDHPSALIDPIWGAKNLFELYGRASMPWEFHAPIFQRAKERGILAFSSPFDDTAIDLLESLDVPAHKVASFELVDLPLLARLAQTKKPLVVSTGMATLGEIEEALEVFEKHGAGPMVLLHCCSTYPADPSTVNLAAMDTMRRAFGKPVGFSDHTVGTAVPTAAVALGAAAIEKHFTDDTSRPGPDHRFSADPETLTRMVRDIRAAEQAIGRPHKGTVPEEEANKRVGRRSIFTRSKIAKGTVVTSDMVRVVRPGSGLHPRFLDVVIGRPARRDIPEGYPITWDDVLAVRLSVNQPSYLPWSGLFERIARADLHVHLDDVQYSKNTFFNRNRVLNRAGREVMLTIPVKAESTHTFLDVTTAGDGWRRKHEASLKQCFPRGEVTGALLDTLTELYARPYANLAEINIAFTEWVVGVLGITTPMVRASTLSLPGASEARLVAMCRHFSADRYYSPSGARAYIDPATFRAAGIALEYQRYEPESYAQSGVAAFVPYLSTLDVLLRHGADEASRVVRAGARDPEEVRG